jgi:hypothetical protein
MNSAAETIGASTVWVQSFETRSVSRLISQTRPRVPVCCMAGIALTGEA